MFDDQNTPSNLPTGKEPEDMFAKVEPAPSPGLRPPSPAGRGVGGEGIVPIPQRPAPVAPPQAPVSPPSPAAPSYAKDETADIEAMAEAEAEVKQPLIASRKLIVVGGIVVGLLVLAGIVIGVLRFVQRTATAPETIAPVADTTVESPALPSSTVPAQSFTGTPQQGEETSGILPQGGSSSSSVATPSAPEAPMDSDGDGLPDNMETATYHTDAHNPDSDTDGLFDGEEVNIYKTDPLTPDTDSDGFLDGQEVRNGYNPKGEGKLLTVPTQ